MCVKIINASHETKYDASRPLEDQIKNAQQIIVNYEPKDASIDLFLKEIERFIKTGIETNLNIKVIHNNHIFGYKLKNKMKRATNDISLNEIIKLMVLKHSNIDKKLEDMVNVCNGIGCNE